MLQTITRNKVCAVEDCESKLIARSYCEKHYDSFMKYGDPLKTWTGFRLQSKHPLYFTWRSMNRRCDTPSQQRYERYGGRGIKVCDRWTGIGGFANFLEDMGDKPGEDYQLDRIDNNGDYEPDNCRWTTRSDNQLNKSTGKDNTSGYKGVGTFVNNRGQFYWRARIGTRTIGYYETFDEALSGRLFGEANIENIREYFDNE